MFVIFHRNCFPMNEVYNDNNGSYRDFNTEVFVTLVPQGTGLQGQAIFKEKLTFRPHSTSSQTHRKMTLSIADRASKAQKIRILPAAGKDPEAQRTELIKVGAQD